MQNGLSWYQCRNGVNMSVHLSKELKATILNNMFVKNYKRMWPYVKPYWKRALLTLLLAIPVGSLDAVIAMAIKPYMDAVMIEKNISSGWYIPILIIGFTCVQGVLTYLLNYLNTWVGAKITNLLKMDLFKKMLSFETNYFTSRNSGDIMMEFSSNANTACSGLLANLKSFIQKFFTSISLIFVLFYNSWQLAIVCTVILVGAFLPMMSLKRKVHPVMTQSMAANAELLTTYNETYAGNKTIVSYNLEQHQNNRFTEVIKNTFRLTIKMFQRTSWITPVMHVIASLGIGLAIWFGSYLILHNIITPGNFVSFLTALIMLYTPIKSIGGTYSSILMSFWAIEKVFEVLDTEPQIKDSEKAVELKQFTKQIKFNNVWFEYVKDTPILQNINLTINHGETIAFVGNSGGGKTTTVNLLPRFYDVTSGNITIDGIDIRDITMKSLRENIAVVFQDNFLFSGTIRENIMLGNENATTEELNTAIKNACLDDFISELKDGIDTQIGERGVLLSGGQKQRIAIARAFLKNAPILILDEATSALDNKSEAIVQKAIENLMNNKTVLVIAHRLSTIKNATKIVVINDGQIVESGTHEELLQISCGAYKTLYDMQFKKK
ncbi:MAG: ABC transporter ATP-binding protein/permease [Alphaproteobacteria bacterium]|nr:ABC transporter ATP-binding protein/permease [Alphaproteobacteria bacterium]